MCSQKDFSPTKKHKLTTAIVLYSVNNEPICFIFWVMTQKTMDNILLKSEKNDMILKNLFLLLLLCHLMFVSHLLDINGFIAMLFVHHHTDATNEECDWICFGSKTDSAHCCSHQYWKSSRFFQRFVIVVSFVPLLSSCVFLLLVQYRLDFHFLGFDSFWFVL